jgi:HK97 family phage major capsid protein
VGDPRRILQMDHERRIGAAIDADMLGGNGASRIVGFRRWNGVTVTELGAGNGATPTLGDVVDAIYRLAADNAKASAIFMHPRVWNTLRKLQDAQQRYQLQPDPTESARQSLFGVPVFISSQIAINETVGSSSDCSYIVVADMSRVVVVRRTQLVVLYDPYTSSATDQAAILTTSRWGFGVLDEEAVEVITGVR